MTTIENRSLHAISDHCIFNDPIDAEGLVEFEQLCLEHPKVQDKISRKELPAGVSVACGPWMYGIDEINEEQRLIQCYLYLLESDDPQPNIYSLLCRFSPVFYGMTKALIRID